MHQLLHFTTLYGCLGLSHWPKRVSLVCVRSRNTRLQGVQLDMDRLHSIEPK